MYDSSGLSLLVDLTPGQRFSIPRTTNPSHLTVYDGWFWFLTNGNPQTGNGNCLYRSNGTAAGTTAFVCDTGTYGLELFNGELYFSRSANGKGYELWKTDGTMSGTVMVKDIVAGGGSALGSTATNRLFTSTDDYLYFSVHTGTANTDHAVWRTDGTAAGTKLVKSSLVASTQSCCDRKRAVHAWPALCYRFRFHLGPMEHRRYDEWHDHVHQLRRRVPHTQRWRSPQHQRKPVPPIFQRDGVHVRPDERCRRCDH